MKLLLLIAVTVLVTANIYAYNISPSRVTVMVELAKIKAQYESHKKGFE